jgi:hypothetical protein
MNQQLITDHAEHCDFYVGNEHWDKSYEEQQRLWVEKFAELIVRECINVVEQWKKEPFPLDADMLSREIRKHFEVDS